MSSNSHKILPTYRDLEKRKSIIFIFQWKHTCSWLTHLIKILEVRFEHTKVELVNGELGG